MPLLDQLEAYRKAAEAKAAAEGAARFVTGDAGPGRARSGVAEHAEFVALGVGQHDPALVAALADRDPGRARASPGVPPRRPDRRGEVEMDPVLDRLRSGTRRNSRGRTVSRSGCRVPGSTHMSPSSSTPCSHPRAADQKRAKEIGSSASMLTVSTLRAMGCLPGRLPASLPHGRNAGRPSTGDGLTAAAGRASIKHMLKAIAQDGAAASAPTRSR